MLQLTLEMSSPTPHLSVTDRAIQRTVAHTEQNSPGWKGQALSLLKGWLDEKGSGFRFQCEDARLCLSFRLKLTSTSRIWGAVIKDAAKQGWVRKVDIGPIDNVRAHGANAAIWETR